MNNAVPEPAAWAMMLVGFGLIGGTMRSAKRRSKLAVSFG
ncbi:PEPxxWA-CTERM sorting domain-containing protein [Sphingopyxis sp.]|nr:PEPxxWA-CTERM sorting domain-containing protein [Sphingopyxis sp.]